MDGCAPLRDRPSALDDADAIAPLEGGRHLGKALDIDGVFAGTAIGVDAEANIVVAVQHEPSALWARHELHGQQVGGTNHFFVCIPQALAQTAVGFGQHIWAFPNGAALGMGPIQVGIGLAQHRGFFSFWI